MVIVERENEDLKLWDADYTQPLDEKDALNFYIINTLVKKRCELGLSQRDLAKLSGIKQSSIARLEAFKTNPTLSTIYRLAKPLGLEVKVELI